MEKILEHEPSIEDESDKEVFQRYMEDLKLRPEDFEKKILDVGSGANKFAKWAKEHNVSSQIYSLEPLRKSREVSKNVKGWAAAMPFQNESFDLVVSNGAIPNTLLAGDAECLKERVKESLYEMLRVTKRGGEIRLGRVIKGDKDSPRGQLTPAIEETLEEMRSKHYVEIEEIHSPPDLCEYKNGKPAGLIARVFLIKIRKPA